MLESQEKAERIEIEMPIELMNFINDRIEDGTYLDPGDCIRHILRMHIYEEYEWTFSTIILLLTSNL